MTMGVGRFESEKSRRNCLDRSPTSLIELCSESVTERAALFTRDLPCEAYVSTTSRLSVTTSGVSAVAGAFQVTLLPDPLKVPSVADHVYWKSLAFDSASVTWTVTGTLSDRSAKLAGSRLRVPWTVNALMT